MVKIIDCPLCNGGTLKIDIPQGYKIITNGALRKLPCVAICKTCNRKVKYKVVKQDENEKA